MGACFFFVPILHLIYIQIRQTEKHPKSAVFAMWGWQNWYVYQLYQEKTKKIPKNIEKSWQKTCKCQKKVVPLQCNN